MEQKKKSQGKEFWAGHIRRWESSATSRRQYCIGAEISYWTFREWQKRLGEVPTAEKDFVQLPVDKLGSNVKSEPTIEVSLPGSITIRINRGFDGELLRALLQELGVLR